MTNLPKDTLLSLQHFEQIKNNIYQANRLIPITDKKRHFPQQSDNTNANSSKTTLRIHRNQQKDAKQQESETQLKASEECVHCLQWKKWAIQEQQALLQLQNKWISRQIEIQSIIRQLRVQITQGKSQTKEISQSCKEFSETIQALKHANTCLQNELNILKNTQKNKRNNNYSTPTKQDCHVDAKQLPGEAGNKILISKIENNSIEKTDNAKASTLPQKKQNHSNTIHLQQLNKRLFMPHKKSQNPQTLQLQNQILKQYNNTLLQQLKALKQRKRV